jgi:hypothetical protein
MSRVMSLDRKYIIIVGGGTVSILAIAFIALSIAFLAVGLVTLVRLKEAKGSLRLAKASIVMTGFCAASAFLTGTVSQLIFEPLPLENPSWLLVRQLYVPMDLFAMLVLAFVDSFAIFATYSGKMRKLMVALVFIVALIPTAYLLSAYNQAVLSAAPPDHPESYLLTVPQYTHILFALCGTPLAIIPLAAFGRSFIIARRIGDRVLGHRAAMMFSSVLLNEAAYAFFAFFTGFVELVSIMLWIPVAFFLLYSVLSITSPLEPKG